MLYAIRKEDRRIRYTCPNKQNLDIMLANANDNISNYLILQEFDMKYVSRITYIDGNCVYNNKEYWTKTAVENPLTLENYSEHEVLDFMNLPVTYDRYIDELNNNINRLSVLDGIAGEIEYNISVGNEFISLFREECIKTELEEVTPLQIAAKTAQIIPMLQTGSFREASQMIDALEPDEFFTVERLAKYKEMLAAADVIEYAT